MGKRVSQKKNAAMLDGKEKSDSFSSAASIKSGYLSELEADKVEVHRENVLDNAVEALLEKRASTREKALQVIIEAFKSHVRSEFVKKQCFTLLQQCLRCIKRGSAREIELASHVIGLLALTVGCGPNAHEILEESFTPISLALKAGTEASKAALLECVAVITFVGGNDPEENERSRQIMWQMIRPKLGPNVVATKASPALITSVVRSWAFVLSRVDGKSRNPKEWQEIVSVLSTLLDKDNRSIRVASGEALAIIFEMGSLELFSSESDGSYDDIHEFTHSQGLKGKLMNQIRNLSMEAGGRGTGNTDLKNQKILFRSILEYIEVGCSPQTSLKIGKETLIISTWSQLIQFNFLKHFLGGGLTKHMQDNEFFQDVFDFTPLQTSDVMQPLSSSQKRLIKSPNSALAKARTQLLNKQRLMCQTMYSGRFAVGMEED